MSLKGKRFAKDMLIEIAWLLGSWAISFGIVGLFIGFDALWGGPVAFQEPYHNSIMVYPPGYFALPFFLFFATIIAGVRLVASRFKRLSSGLVLTGLGLGWIVLLKFVWWVSSVLK